jgi:DNA-binding MarR family transcriptional regulator
MHRRTDAALAKHRITADQFVLMSALARGEATTQRELARRTASDPSTVRAMLVLLESRKLISRERHPTDARARTVALTAKGRRVHEQLWTASESVRQELLAAVGSRDADTLFAALNRIASDLQEASEPVESVATH